MSEPEDFEGMQGQFYRPEPYADTERFTLDGGSGSMSLPYRLLDDPRPRPDEDHVWFASEYAGGVDYGPTGLVGKANFKVLREEAERLSADELDGDTSWFQVFHGGHGTYEIAFHVERTPEEIIEMLAGLSNYPLIDDQALSELEVEAQDEAWESWAESDYRKALGKEFGGDAEDVEDDELKRHFMEASEAANEYWESQEGDSMWIDVEKVASGADEPPRGMKLFYEVTYYRTDDADFTHTEKWYVLAPSAAKARELFASAVKFGDEGIWEESFSSRPEDSGDDTYYVYLDDDEFPDDPTVLMIKVGDAEVVDEDDVESDKLIEEG